SNTLLAISTHSNTRSGQPGFDGNFGMPHPFIVTLNRGQVYWVKATVGYDNDMSGSTIVSNKPVAVLGGHEDALNGYSSIPSEQRNILVQEMTPVQYWGDAGFYTLPFVDLTYSGLNFNLGDLFKFFVYSKTYDWVQSDNGSGSPHVEAFQ